MGLFDFAADIVSATVKVAITPVTIVTDVVKGEPFEDTSELLESAHDDLLDAFGLD